LLWFHAGLTDRVFVDGEFAGKQILPKGWADTARRLQSTIPKDEPLADFEYGQQFWVCRDERFGGFACLGYQGQFTYILPGWYSSKRGRNGVLTLLVLGLDMVIVRNGETPMEILTNVIEDQIYALRDALAGV
jgi:hypothetical protein